MENFIFCAVIVERAFYFRDAAQYISSMWLLHFNLQSKVTLFQIFAGRISKEWPELIKDNAVKYFRD